MAKKAVAFVPIGQATANQVNAPSKIEEPQYPDVGVQYAGYSKTPLSSNQFRLNVQERVDYNAGQVFTGVNSSQLFSLSQLPRGKTFYISSLSAHGWHNARTIIRLERSDGSTIAHFAIDTNNYNLTIEPITPIKIELKDNTSQNYILVRYLQASTAAGDATYLDVYGWTE